MAFALRLEKRDYDSIYTSWPMAPWTRHEAMP